MKINKYMDCFINECKETDPIREVVRRISSEKLEQLIVIDKYGKYAGFISALDLLTRRNHSGRAGEYMKLVAPLDENLDIRKIKEFDYEAVPIINEEHYPVGILRLKDVLPIFRTIGEAENTGKKYFKKSLQSKYSIDDLIGNSEIILKLKESIIKAAKLNSTVLLLGETGVGKELVAQSIASLSERRFKPFVRLNCAAIPDNLLESELFGYEGGAYTGASQKGNTGKFELADSGTILLDEIGDMKMMMQAKILRVLQEKEIEKIGGRYPIPVDVRVIAATHADLKSMVDEGTFRKDLFYRLNVIPIRIPPLREHLEDLEMLIDYFVKKYVKEFSFPSYSIEDGVYELLKRYDWPGNVRELRNTVEMLVGMTSGNLDVQSVSSLMDDKISIVKNSSVLKCNVDETEKDTIIRYLSLYEDNKMKVAEILGISRSSLYNKLKKYEIK